MKKLDLIISRERLREVNDLLRKHKVGGVTFYDIHGRGRSIPRPDIPRDTTSKTYIDPEFGTRIKLEVLVENSLVKALVKDMFELPSKGPADYSKIFVYDVAEAYDTGTKKTGDSAL